MDIHDAVLEIRKKYCEICQEQFTTEELDNGAMCEICKECKKLGKTVAKLQD